MINKGGRPKNPPKFKEMLKSVIPMEEIFSKEELPIYEGMVDIYLKDFDPEEMSSGDMDDIMSLAMNRVLEIRLLKTSKGDADRQIDISASIEKIRKQNDKLRENLSMRRKDRINPNDLKGFSIVDLAVAFDDDKKLALQEKALKLKKEEKVVKDKRKDYIGNRYDIDSDKKDKDSDDGI